MLIKTCYADQSFDDYGDMEKLGHPHDCKNESTTNAPKK